MPLPPTCGVAVDFGGEAGTTGFFPAGRADEVVTALTVAVGAESTGRGAGTTSMVGAAIDGVAIDGAAGALAARPVCSGAGASLFRVKNHAVVATPASNAAPPIATTIARPPLDVLGAAESVGS